MTATVRRRRCGTDTTCASVTANGVTVAPAVAVETSSPVAPTTTSYLDELGRVVRTRTQAFSGAHDIREDTVFDARGRVSRRSAPHFANATQAQAVGAGEGEPVLAAAVLHAAVDGRKAADAPAVAEQVRGLVVLEALALAAAAVVDGKPRSKPPTPGAGAMGMLT